MTIAQAPQPGSDPNFTGVVTTMDAKDITGGRRTFEAERATAWHSHDKGQLISPRRAACAPAGANQGYKEYDEGGSEYTPPNVEHWHGATPAGPLTQVNIQFGGTTKWL
jgi:quercetin dioxygenase-like cupin family protein